MKNTLVPLVEIDIEIFHFCRKNFFSVAKDSKGIEEYVEKILENKEGSTNDIDSVKLDKALQVFKVEMKKRFNNLIFWYFSVQAIDKDGSGYIDKKVFLSFARYGL